MQSNAETRRPLTEKQIVRNMALLLAHFRGKVERESDLESKDLLQRVEALFDHMIEITVEGTAIATWSYKPLKPREV